MQPKNTNETIRLLFSICLIPVGALLILLHSETPTGNLVSHIGSALIVAGVLSTFHEAVLRRFEQGETALAVADEVITRLQASPLGATGIRLLSRKRKGEARYYEWVTSTRPEDIFLAGRSVLHRLDADLVTRNMGSAEDAIARRLAEGAKIKILLIDPRSNIVPRLAQEEAQSLERLLTDLAVSLGICSRLHDVLAGRSVPASATLDICVFDEIPYFAYHSVGESMIIGFYFTSTLGHQSAAYEVVDLQTKEFFAEHFRSVFGRASSTFVLRINPHSGEVELNRTLLAELRSAMVAAIGERATDQHMTGRSR